MTDDAVESPPMAKDSGSTSFTAAGPGPSRPRQWVWPLIGGLALGAIVAAIAVSSRRAPAAPPTRTELTRLSSDDGHSDMAPAISPDGKRIAYASNRSGRWEIWLQPLGGGTPSQLTQSDGIAGGPSFFPDGSRVLYSTTDPSLDETAIRIVPVSGGIPQKLWSGPIVTSPVDLRGPILSPDGSRFAFLERQGNGTLRLMVMATAGDRPRPVPGFDRIVQWSREPAVPSWAPDGRSVLYLALSASDRTNWEWFSIPVDGGDPVELGAGAALRRAGFDAVAPGVVSGNRALFWGSFTRPHVFDVPLAKDTWKVTGPPRQLTFGRGRYDPTSVTPAGLAMLERPVSSIDFYAIPLDRASGHASGPTRRLTTQGLGTPIFDVGGDPVLSYVVMWEASGDALTAKALRLRLDTGEPAPLPSVDVNRDGLWTVSRDGRLLARSRPEKNAYTIAVSEVDGPARERVLCQDCGLAQGFSPDGRFLFFQPEASSKPNVRRRTTIRLLDVASGVPTPWLEDRTDFLSVRGLTGNSGEWVIVAATTPGATARQTRTFLVPWRVQSVPRSDWIEVVGENVKFSPAGDLAYFFDGARLMAMRFDPKSKVMGTPFQVRLARDAQPVLKPGDSWVVRGPGIVFSATDVKSSIWLLNLAKDVPH